MKRIDFTNLGGLPFSQNRADYMQQSYTEALGAIAKLCGDKVILHGVESDGVNVTDGWIAYNNELIFFVGGSFASDVVITELTTPFNFGNNISHNVYFTKIATCGLSGAFPFTDLVPLLSLQHTWKKDDIRMCVKDAAYEAANFDSNGYGTSPAEKGWRILSKAYPNAAGAVMVNKKDADTDFGTVGNHGGEKAHTNQTAEQGTFTVSSTRDDIGGGGASVTASIKFNGTLLPENGGSNQSSYGTPLTVSLSNATNAHNNLQPYFVILTLIKL